MADVMIDFVVGHISGILLVIVCLVLVAAGVYGYHCEKTECERARVAFMECIDSDRTVEYCGAFSKYDFCRDD